MQQALEIFEKTTQKGLALTKKEWESFTYEEKNEIIKIIKEHRHEGFFKSWQVCGTEDHKRIYCCGVCREFKRDKNFNPFLFDEDL